jgi:hypothetical protein
VSDDVALIWRSLMRVLVLMLGGGALLACGIGLAALARSWLQTPVASLPNVMRPARFERATSASAGQRSIP